MMKRAEVKRGWVSKSVWWTSMVQMVVLEEGLAVLQCVPAWTLLDHQSKEAVDFDFGADFTAL